LYEIKVKEGAVVSAAKYFARPIRNKFNSPANLRNLLEMSDMKMRMDEKDGDIEGLNEKVDCLQEQMVTLCREFKTEKNGWQDDMNALREVRRS